MLLKVEFSEIKIDGKLFILFLSKKLLFSSVIKKMDEKYYFFVEKS